MKVIKLVLGVLFARRLLFAYIDPNTGGMLFQFLAVAFGLLSAGLLFFSSQIRAMWARIRRTAREQGESDELPGDDIVDLDQGEE